MSDKAYIDVTPSKEAERKPPRRFRFWDIGYAQWFYGCHFPSCATTVLENGVIIPTKLLEASLLKFEWIDLSTE